MRVHLASKHALELEAADLALEPLRILLDVPRRGLVTLGLGEIQELGRIGDTFGGAVDLGEVGTETRALPPELLRPIGLRPDGRVFELPRYLLEALFLAVVLKETPGARQYARLSL